VVLKGCNFPLTVSVPILSPLPYILFCIKLSIFLLQWHHKQISHLNVTQLKKGHLEFQYLSWQTRPLAQGLPGNSDKNQEVTKLNNCYYWITPYFCSTKHSKLVSVSYETPFPKPVMGKLFKEGAKGKEKNFRRANIIY